MEKQAFKIHWRLGFKIYLASSWLCGNYDRTRPEPARKSKLFRQWMFLSAFPKEKESAVQFLDESGGL